MLMAMVVPTPVPIEQLAAYQFTVSDAEAVQTRTNGVLSKEDTVNPRTWRLTVLTYGFVTQSAKVGDWIVEKGGFHRVYTPEEFHRTFSIVSATGNPADDPANKTIQANPVA